MVIDTGIIDGHQESPVKNPITSKEQVTSREPVENLLSNALIIGGQLVFFLVAFGLAINLIFLLFIFVVTDCLMFMLC